MDRYTNLQPATDAVDGARSFSIMTSRGCPYRCTFCSQSIMPIKWRARSSENVIEEWRHLVHDLGALEIGVLDDSANIRKHRLTQLADLLIAEKLNHVPWIFVNGIRANLADTRVAGQAEAGGPEAHGLRRRDRRRRDDLKHRQEHRSRHDPPGLQERQRGRAWRRSAFSSSACPATRARPCRSTIDFAIELDPLIANFSMMTPYPGTKVYEEVKRHGTLPDARIGRITSSLNRRHATRWATSRSCELRWPVVVWSCTS